MSGPARTPDSAFWVDRPDVDGDRLRLSAPESRHLLRVFRAVAGTPFEAVDGQGTLYRCLLDGADDGVAVGRIESRVENSGEMAASITLLAGLPDLPQVETIVALAVPLGATAIDFVATGRSSGRALSKARLERLERIARSALKQSRRTRMPAIRSSERLELALGESDAPGARFLADPDGEPLRTIDPGPPGQAQVSVILTVGPPGGFLREESDLLRARGFAPISIGPSRLRTSTALLALLAAARNLLLSSGLGRVDKTGLSGYLQ
jgi:16S rRNA (uracil1498-N3)-methyltransferase